MTLQYHMDSHDGTYKNEFQSRVTAVYPGIVELEETAFYHLGGGQPPDKGKLIWDDGENTVYDVRKKNRIRHMVEGDLPEIGDLVNGKLNWDRRYKHMRMHSCLHLLCSLVEGGVTGGSISVEKSRLDFDLQDVKLDKEALTEGLNKLVAENHALSASWITDEEMEAQQDLVRNMSVKPPSGEGRVRLMHVEGVDLQPCGGTHVKASGEIGAVRVSKIENKGARNRRVNIVFDE